MRKKIILLTAVMVIAGLLLTLAWQYTMALPPRQIAKTYLRALASGDVAGAKAVSTGRAAEAAGKLEGKNLAVRVDEISTSVQALGRGWARVKATVELTLQDGTADVGWYELELLKGGEAWKVYSFKETTPRIEGYRLGRPGKEDLREAKTVLKGYLDDLAAGKYKDAARWLVGPALKEHLTAGEYLSRGKLIDAPGSLSVTPMALRGRLFVVRVDYSVGEAEARAAVLFYRLAKGWRIVQISRL
jgi:hypothetical protein